MSGRGFAAVEAVVASALILLLSALTLRGAVALRGSASSRSTGLVAAGIASAAIVRSRGEGPPSDAPGDVTETLLRNGVSFDLTRRWRRSPDPLLWRLTVVVGWGDTGVRRNRSAETWVWRPAGG